MSHKRCCCRRERDECCDFGGFGGFDGGCSWIIIIIVLVLFCGNGRNC